MAERKTSLRNLSPERTLNLSKIYMLKPGEAVKIHLDKEQGFVRVWNNKREGKDGFYVYLPGLKTGGLPRVERLLIKWEIPVGGSVSPWMLEHDPKKIKQLEKMSKDIAARARMPVQDIHVHHVVENEKPVIILENRGEKPVRISIHRW